ncbi:MAG: hypothetical protein ABI425_02065 [Patescibacteria group bacterium]
MDPVIIILTIVICIFGIVLVVAGIQVILVLQEVKLTLKKVNILTETFEKATNQVIAPLAGLGGTMDGLKSGLKVATAFMSWLNKEGKKE